MSCLRRRMTPQRFATWFVPIIPLSIDEKACVLEVPNPFFVDWFEEHNLPVLRQTFQEALGWQPEISFRVRDGYREEFERRVGEVHSSPTPASTVARPGSGNGNGNLSKRFCFSDFVVGHSNELAHAACQAVAKQPGRVYNPLFIYGGVGLGKTHLMHAIGHALQEQTPGARIHYVPAETFMNQMIEAIRAGRTIEFREHYRSLDLLLVDDIQFLSGRGRTEEEFFHTFNILHEANKQVVVSCDRPPSDLVSLEERLTSRFQSGLVADIHPPDLETRVAILRQKASRENREVPDRVLFMIAEAVRSNIRELGGVLVRLFALADLTKGALTEDLAQDAIRQFARPGSAAAPDVATIQKVVAKHFDVSVESLRGKRRTSQVAQARQVAMYITKQHTGLTLVEIGRRFGNRDHSTVIYALNRVTDELSQNENLREKVAAVEAELGLAHLSGNGRRIPSSPKVDTRDVEP